MQIFNSRFTEGVTGDKVNFQIGEIVKYKLLNGNIIDAKIDSERMSHRQCENLGYECVFLDNNQRGFADGKRIIEWEDQVKLNRE